MPIRQIEISSINALAGGPKEIVVHSMRRIRSQACVVMYGMHNGKTRHIGRSHFRSPVIADIRGASHRLIVSHFLYENFKIGSVWSCGSKRIEFEHTNNRPLIGLLDVDERGAI